MILDSLKDTLRFDHIGIAVTDFEPAIALYSQMGYTCSKPVIDPLQNVDLVMCYSDTMPNIELVKPLDIHSPINSLLKNNSESLYHTCFGVSDLKRTIETIKKTHRVICVKHPKPAILFDNKPVSFYYISGIGLVEFIEE